MIQRLLLGGALVGLVAPPASAAPLPSKPNIVLILADDLGWMDTGIYGSSFYRTPNLDALAHQGMLFTNAYAAAPLCSASRASIMSGQYAARTGMTGASGHLPAVRLKAVASAQDAPPYHSASVAEVTRLDTKIRTIAEALKEAGYVTGHYGKWHIGPEPYSPLQQGFDVDVPHYAGPGPAGSYMAPWKFPPKLHFNGKPGENIEDRMAQEAIKFIDANKDHPFYLNYWAFSVHAPFDAKPELVDKYRKLADLTKPQHQAVMAAMVESFDDAVGTLVAEVTKDGLRDKTVLILTSDNGGNMYDRIAGEPPTNNAPLRGGKATIFEGGSKVPCIVSWPGIVKPGTQSDALTMGTDLYPTLIQIGGGKLDPAQPMDGVSLVPLLTGGAKSVRDEVLIHFPHNVPATGNLTSTYLRKKDWVLIRTYDDLPDGGDRYELYNLVRDPSEAHDVAADNPAVVAELRAKMDDLLKATRAVLPQPNQKYDPAQKPKTPVMPAPGPSVPSPFLARPAMPLVISGPAGMRWIPVGEFAMGAVRCATPGLCSPAAFHDAQPIHRVSVDGFWMDATEVTNDQFRNFADATKYVTVAERAPTRDQFPDATPDALVAGSLVFTPPPRPVSTSDPRQWWTFVPEANWRHPLGPGSVAGPNDPVVQVAYEDAAAYAQWAGKRLPTEAEWEYAARGGLAGKDYAWGNDFAPGGKFMANTFQGTFPIHDTGADGFVGIAPVKSFPANGYGLFDMAGNVWEWCSDWYRPDAYQTSAVHNPTGPPSSDDPAEPGMLKRVQRGGSFLCSDQYCSAYAVGARGRGEVSTGSNHVGFRCVAAGVKSP